MYLSGQQAQLLTKVAVKLSDRNAALYPDCLAWLPSSIPQLAV